LDIGCFEAFFCFSNITNNFNMKAHNIGSQSTITPAIALQYLKEGNQRFVSNLKHHRNLLHQVNETRNGQWPFAVVLSCIDSRTSAELIFDQGLGDIFSVRIAGNIVNDDILGSMEFACKVSGSKFILVLGHSKCGAIKGACDNVHLGNLTGLLNKIKPSVLAESTITENRNSDNYEFVEKVSDLNIHHSVSEILDRSEILREMVKSGEVGIIGASYDVETGIVDFYDDTLSNMQHQYHMDSISTTL
jgi:carbonic anhydrase